TPKRSSASRVRLLGGRMDGRAARSSKGHRLETRLGLLLGLAASLTVVLAPGVIRADNAPPIRKLPPPVPDKTRGDKRFAPDTVLVRFKTGIPRAREAELLDARGDTL